MQTLVNTWPLILLLLWFGYRWLNTRQVINKLPALKQSGAILLDVRTLPEFAHASAPDTLNIPLQELSERLDELPKGVPIVVGCASGTRSAVARVLLRKHGYAPVYNIGAWRNFTR